MSVVMTEEDMARLPSPVAVLLNRLTTVVTLATEGRKDSMPQARKRYAFSPYPDGWYFASTSADLQPGDIKPLELVGRDLVLFRTKGGKAVVVNAHCPHLGAHVGIGGAMGHYPVRAVIDASRFRWGTSIHCGGRTSTFKPCARCDGAPSRGSAFSSSSLSGHTIQPASDPDSAAMTRARLPTPS